MSARALFLWAAVIAVGCGDPAPVPVKVPVWGTVTAKAVETRSGSEYVPAIGRHVTFVPVVTLRTAYVLALSDGSDREVTLSVYTSTDVGDPVVLQYRDSL